MIRGKLINLRLVEEKDLDIINALDHDIMEKGDYWPLSIVSNVRFRKSFSDNGFWNENNGMMLITDKENNILGHMSYFQGVWYMPGYEVGYRIYRNENRGKGYTTEALKLFTAFLFDSKNINRLEIENSKGNIGSRKVCEKCGFKYEGLKRQAVYSTGKYEDVELFSLLREESPSLKELLIEHE